MERTKLSEVMYVQPVDTVHSEEYLEALWLLENAGEHQARIRSLAQLLDIAPPSVVQMLKKMEEMGLVKYPKHKGVSLTRKGREIGKKMVRNGRLMEVFAKNKLKIEVDDRLACGMEHHMTEEFSNALCTYLNHPRECPHGFKIPKGVCCL